jgi:lipopolysaccharide transport system ATP-binding protein
MDDVVIRVDRLGKRYRLGERKPYRSLGESISGAIAIPFRSRHETDGRAAKENHVWALSDVSFEVTRGEVIGIIGPNGAGKSTLLKILSRITRPTNGTARIRGRVASLLEVGTGFHLDLTGRDNIYLNGVVLGMSRREVERKFDEIVEFSGVERFLDTQVKRYSSGMIVRLGFAVAAHLEPEILIVDEVLAVGDAEFQRKCLGKMDDVAREGRTVLFVSHNMNAMQRLCPRALALKLGKVVREGPTREVIAWYLADAAPTHAADGWLETMQLPRQGGSGQVRVVALSCSSGDESIGFQPYPECPLEVKLLLESDAERGIGSVAVTLRDQLGTILINTDTANLGKTVRVVEGRTVVTVRIQALHLTPGTYVLGWWIADPVGVVYDSVERANHIEVVDVRAPGFGKRPNSDGVVTCDVEISEEPER